MSIMMPFWLFVFCIRTVFAAPLLSCDGTKPNRTLHVSLTPAGRFPTLHSNDSLDIGFIDRHSAFLAAKYTHLTGAYTKASGWLTGRTLAFESLQYESDGMIWKTDVTVGGQEVAVELDTASPDCLIEADVYDPRDTEPERQAVGTFNTVLSNDMVVSGDVWEETFGIAGIEIANIAIGMATHPFMPRTYHVDGLCGLAWPTLSALNRDNFFFEMVDRQTLSNPLFGVALSRRGHSELSLGGVNSNLYDDLTFVPLVGEHGFWEIEGFILVGDRALPQVFIMDSTAHVIDMSRDSATILFQLLGLRIVWTPNGSLIGVYHCTRPPVISFQFGPRIITLNPTDIKLGYHN
ncbi:hypothetical protein V8E36_002249, partial [Tilletia maclaganii]